MIERESHRSHLQRLSHPLKSLGHSIAGLLPGSHKPWIPTCTSWIPSHKPWIPTCTSWIPSHKPWIPTCTSFIPIFPPGTCSLQCCQVNLAQPRNVHDTHVPTHVCNHVPRYISCDAFRYHYHCYCESTNLGPPRFSAHELTHVARTYNHYGIPKIQGDPVLVNNESINHCPSEIVS